jgi:hypothetical protein
MNPELVRLVLDLGTIAAKLALEIKAQSGKSDEELLDTAAHNNAEARAAAKAFLESLKSA